MSTLHPRKNSPAVAALFVLILTSLFVSLRLALLERSLPPTARVDAASLFVVARHEQADPAHTPPGLIVLPGAGDYDGVAFYRLALDPFSTCRTEGGITLVNMLYRQQRLMYPLLVWALSAGGSPRLIPALLIGVNILTLAALAGLAGAHARSVGRSALWGVVPALYPGFALSLSYDTAEPLELCFLLATFLLARRGWFSGAAACLTLAILTRETAVLVALAALAVWLWPRLTRAGATSPVPARFFAAPLLAYAVWHLLLLRVWGMAAAVSLHVLVGIPGKGILLFIRWFAGVWTPLHWLWMGELVFLLALGVAVLAALRSSRAPSYEKIAWLCYAGLMPLLTRAVWAGDSAYLRVAAEFVIIGFLILLQTPRHSYTPLFAASLALWLLVAGHVLAAGLPLRRSVFEVRRLCPAPVILPKFS